MVTTGGGEHQFPKAPPVNRPAEVHGMRGLDFPRHELWALIEQFRKARSDRCPVSLERERQMQFRPHWWNLSHQLSGVRWLVACSRQRDDLRQVTRH